MTQALAAARGGELAEARRAVAALLNDSEAVPRRH